MGSLVLAALFGAAVAYFLDPDRGRERRGQVRDRVSSAGSRLGSQVKERGRRHDGSAEGEGNQASMVGGQMVPAEPVGSATAPGSTASAAGGSTTTDRE